MTSEKSRFPRRIGTYAAAGALLFALGLGAASTFQTGLPAAVAQTKDTPPATAPKAADQALPDLVERLVPSVVNIATISGQAQARPAQRPDAPFDE